MSLREAHDRMWASRGVQVVRPGGAPVQRKGPRVYLLMAPDDLSILPLSKVMQRYRWLKPRVLRLRVVELEREGYDERVLADDDGRFLGVQRDYRPATAATMRTALTPEPGLAALWRDAPDARSGWRAIREVAGPSGCAVDATRGMVFRLGDRFDEQRAGEALLERWREPGASLEGVYEFSPGVWLHETAEVAPGARFVGPVWVGAGVRVGPGSVLVGPAIAPDADGGRAATTAQAPVDWDAVAAGAVRVFPRLGRRPRRATKRAFDIAFSLAVLTLTAPLYPIIGLAIIIEDGWPVFFAHRRQTIRGREFPCYKFRTMCRNAEQLKAELAKANQADGPQFFIDDDPRLLKVGKLLRKFQLDELPQFLNVLFGHMSVVGPRPSPDKENQYCPAWREARLSVRPGVTGLWQVRRTREPETDFQEWIRFDLEYVQHESWRLDLWIILQTVKKVFGG
jgi:lipopolysaccharide/colanic/teichoic acid biosynthesis glycosyltransferase